MKSVPIKFGMFKKSHKLDDIQRIEVSSFFVTWKKKNCLVRISAASLLLFYSLRATFLTSFITMQISGDETRFKKQKEKKQFGRKPRRRFCLLKPCKLKNILTTRIHHKVKYQETMFKIKFLVKINARFLYRALTWVCRYLVFHSKLTLVFLHVTKLGWKIFRH